jgi:hypothetical protein
LLLEPSSGIEVAFGGGMPKFVCEPCPQPCHHIKMPSLGGTFEGGGIGVLGFTQLSEQRDRVTDIILP